MYRIIPISSRNIMFFAASYFDDHRHVPGAVSHSDDAILYLVLRGKALSHQVDNMFDIMCDLLRNANLNNQKRAVEVSMFSIICVI